MFTSIAGRAVVVTGATRGIGKGIAGVFAGAGARVLITGRDEDAAKGTVAELSAAGGDASYVLGDVSRREDCQRIAATAAERLGGIDVLCANAGIFPSAPLAEMTDENIDEMLGTNLKGTILSVQACLPALAASGHGRVILTSSITGPVTGFPGWSHYGASKAGQLGFLRTAAIELAAALARRRAPAPADLSAAQAVLDAAAGEAEQLGMVPFIKRIDQLRSRLPATSAGRSPLSPREVEVAKLVARGMTNKQIGETLFVSERTAENHVQHILVKLGFSNRSQIAAWSRE